MHFVNATPSLCTPHSFLARQEPRPPKHIALISARQEPRPPNFFGGHASGVPILFFRLGRSQAPRILFGGVPNFFL